MGVDGHVLAKWGMRLVCDLYATCVRLACIPRWFVGVSPLPMKPMLAVRVKERCGKDEHWGVWHVGEDGV